MLVAFWGLVSLNSCDDFLQTETQSNYTTDVVFASPAYTYNALMGVYSLLTQDHTYSIRLSMYYTMNTDIEAVAFANNQVDDNGRRGIGNYLSSPGNTELERPWNTLYQAIERANLIIAEIPKSAVVSNGTDAEKAAMWSYYGEALTLRALFYAELARNWGDVPFKTEPTNPNGTNFFLPKTNRSEIFDALILDLDEAETYVPWITQSSARTPERITKSFVKGLKARIALSRGGYSYRKNNQMERDADWLKYYEIANKETKDVIESGIHSLNPSFKNVFYSQCQLRIDNTYNESLFEIGNGISRSGEAGYYIGVRFATSPKYGYGNGGGVVTTPYYLYSFDPTDSRRLVSVAFYAYDATPQQVIYNMPYDYRIGKWSYKWMTETYLNLNRAASNKLLTGVNWSMMRYSDVLLMFAETENVLNGGPTGAAKQALKDVRKRAFPVSQHASKVEAFVEALGNQSDFFNAIVDERALEFGGEGIRKYDLIRWNLLKQKIDESKEMNRRIVDGLAPYDNLPAYLFYRYDVNDPEELDFANLNLDVDLGSDQIPGYTRIAWLRGLSDTNKTTFKTWLDLHSSGLNQNPNRHLVPIAQSVVESANGVFVNDYGY